MASSPLELSAEDSQKAISIAENIGAHFHIKLWTNNKRSKDQTWYNVPLEKPSKTMFKCPKTLFSPGKQNFSHHDDKGKEP